MMERDLPPPETRGETLLVPGGVVFSPLLSTLFQGAQVVAGWLRLRCLGGKEGSSLGRTTGEAEASLCSGRRMCLLGAQVCWGEHRLPHVGTGELCWGTRSDLVCTGELGWAQEWIWCQTRRAGVQPG